MISLIVAADMNGNIGYDNKLLWDLPEDMKFFRRKTLGNTVVMGRKTYESIGKPLPKRNNILLTRNKDFKIEGITVLNDIEGILTINNRKIFKSEIFIIGGSEIYEQFLPHTDRIYMTVVNTKFDITEKNYDKFPLTIGMLENSDSWFKRNLGVHLKDEKHKYDILIHQFDRTSNWENVFK